jgi:SAM-dependent methyltransferase
MKGTAKNDLSSQLRDEIIRLGPWHLEVQVTDDISTRVFLQSPETSYSPSVGKVSFISPRESFRSLMQKVYPGGLAGRSVLDCACNCGGYLYWAKELGAGECFGFDVRQHWIDQARFLAQTPFWERFAVSFQLCDLYDLPKLGLKPFDITIFKGIFYHLPDPITGLKIVADLTKELILVDTATKNGCPDGMLAVSEEDRVAVMSGVHGLNWFPTGPNVLARVLNWLGFSETHCVFWQNGATENQPANLGRLQILGSRKPGLFLDLSACRITV